MGEGFCRARWTLGGEPFILGVDAHAFRFLFKLEEREWIKGADWRPQGYNRGPQCRALSGAVIQGVWGCSIPCPAERLLLSGKGYRWKMAKTSPWARPRGWGAQSPWGPELGPGTGDPSQRGSARVKWDKAREGLSLDKGLPSKTPFCLLGAASLSLTTPRGGRQDNRVGICRAKRGNKVGHRCWPGEVALLPQHQARYMHVRLLDRFSWAIFLTLDGFWLQLGGWSP